MTTNANDIEIKFLHKSHRISEKPAELSNEFLERKRNFWKEKIKKDGIRNVVAPMVDQSEVAFRMFCRKYSAHLCYTPMIHAHLFVNDTTYRRNSFTTIDADRPLIVQFCANDPEVLLNACRLVEDYCDGVDINLGCPQLIAKKGHYGAFLQEYPELIEQMISHVHKYCRIPLSAKIRMLDDLPSTIEYAKRIERAGAAMLTIHGRTREQKGDNTGLANWEVIRALKNKLTIPVLANGNIQLFDDIERCIMETGVDGVMSAEGILNNPMLFHDRQNRFNYDVAVEYLDFAEKYNAPFFAVRAHLFRICHYSFFIFDDLRDRNGICSDLKEFRENIQELRKRSLEEIKSKGIEYGQNPWIETLGRCFPGNVELKGITLAKLVHSTPHYFCKPYIRPSASIGTTNDSTDQITTFSLIRQKKREELERLISETGLSKRQIQKREKRKRNKQKEVNRRKQIYPECERCQKPAGQNCANQMCRRCCKFVCFRGIQLKCKGHCFEHEKFLEKQIFFQNLTEIADGENKQIVEEEKNEINENKS